MMTYKLWKKKSDNIITTQKVKARQIITIMWYDFPLTNLKKVEISINNDALKWIVSSCVAESVNWLKFLETKLAICISNFWIFQKYLGEKHNSQVKFLCNIWKHALIWIPKWVHQNTIYVKFWTVIDWLEKYYIYKSRNIMAWVKYISKYSIIK